MKGSPEIIILFLLFYFSYNLTFFLAFKKCPYLLFRFYPRETLVLFKLLKKELSLL